jgi:hypothetical protein
VYIVFLRSRQCPGNEDNRLNSPGPESGGKMAEQRKDEIKDLPKKDKPLSDEDLAGIAGGRQPTSGGLGDTSQHMSDTEVDD